MSETRSATAGHHDRHRRADTRGGAAPHRSSSQRRAGTPPGGARYRRALRREAPTVVAVLLTDADFAAMTGYTSFPFTDYGRYLHHLDGTLRTLHTQGKHIAVTVFDPAAFADHCATTGRPPDTAAARAQYTAEITAARAAVPYARQPLPLLLAELGRAAERRAVWERATDVLLAAGPCPACGQDLAHCAFDRASHTLMRVLEAVGSGAHHVVCSLPAAEGPPLVAAVHADAGADGDIRLAETDALVLCTVIAAAAVTARAGGLVVRTTDDHGTDTVRGWALRAGEPHPLSEAEVFSAYCTDAATGDPVPPEPGVVHRAGLVLPPPLPHDGPTG
jgi:hypothetical protein